MHRLFLILAFILVVALRGPAAPEPSGNTSGSWKLIHFIGAESPYRNSVVKYLLSRRGLNSNREKETIYLTREAALSPEVFTDLGYRVVAINSEETGLAGTELPVFMLVDESGSVQFMSQYKDMMSANHRDFDDLKFYMVYRMKKSANLLPLLGDYVSPKHVKLVEMVGASYSRHRL